MSKRRFVVTGLGVVSPVGNGVKEAWDNLLAGESGVESPRNRSRVFAP